MLFTGCTALADMLGASFASITDLVCINCLVIADPDSSMCEVLTHSLRAAGGFVGDEVLAATAHLVSSEPVREE